MPLGFTIWNSQTACVTFVVGQPLKVKAMALGEVGADTDRILTHDVVDVLDRFDVIVNGVNERFS